jgi:ABC-type uncharacterized transport system substrate-binding protein
MVDKYVVCVEIQILACQRCVRRPGLARSAPAPDDAESMRRFAKELVALQPDLILSNTTPTTTALLQQTRTIPIVFAIVADPIGSGFVASFARPGGNVTGFIFTEPTMAGKWLELLKEIAHFIDAIGKASQSGPRLGGDIFVDAAEFFG